MAFNRVLLLGFLIPYVFLIGILRSSCQGDPTSTFFQPERAHLSPYSTHRIQQATRHAELAANLPQPRAQMVPEICIGIPSVRREGISYLKLTLGSLQQGLTLEERMRLRFVVLFAHVNQTEHPDYGEPWVTGMVDKVVSYHDDHERLRLAHEVESQGHAIKSKFDYSVVMEECAKTGAPYILMTEDDVVFMDGWRHRTKKALDVAMRKSWDLGHTNFLYLRLFYYEGLLGWNSESWPKYLASSLGITALVLSGLLLARRSPIKTAHLPPTTIFLITFVFTPLLILLFFAAGPNCVIPQRPGVHRMDAYACCGQGLAFPRATVTEKILPLFRNNLWSDEPTDSFIEMFANHHHDDTDMGEHLVRWALTPVVMQHVGAQSSHSGRRGRDTYGPARLWNFAFEGNDAASLAVEHARAVVLEEEGEKEQGRGRGLESG